MFNVVGLVVRAAGTVMVTVLMMVEVRCRVVVTTVVESPTPEVIVRVSA